jgi:aminoglycoside phosphotransferase (APT) family kinase protein
MTATEVQPSAGALEEVRRLAGSSAVIVDVVRLEGGQHADTWRVETDSPALSVVVRQFPIGDCAASREQRALRSLDGLGGLAPLLLAGDVDGRWSQYPTSVISWLDGEPDITPSDPEKWASELGRGLALVHETPSERLAGLPRVFDDTRARAKLTGPLAPEVLSRWSQLIASSEVLTHRDYWSGNVVWRDGKLTGVADWPGAARGQRGYDVSWCRLDLVLLFDGRIADVFLEAYQAAIGRLVGDVDLWDAWALARSHDIVESWAPNYAPLGRRDLDEQELRSRHSRWTARLLEQT